MPITNIYGTDSADHIVGTSINEQIWGLGGDDYLSGQGGSDWLIGEGGNDILVGDYGEDTLIGGAGSDAMFGGFGNDLYRVEDAGDSTWEIRDAGRDSVYSTIDWVLSNYVEDLYLYNPAANAGAGIGAIRATGNGLANVIEGNTLNNIINGLGGNDTVRGWAGNDRINGGAGNDTLLGDLGNDILSGGIGSDVMNGGRGNDRYLFTQTDVKMAWVDTVRFGRGEDDKIDLRPIDAIAGGANDAFSFVGSSGFSGTTSELRYEYFGRWLALENSVQVSGELFRILGDVNGDGHADFAILAQVEESFPEEALGLYANDFWL